MAVIVIGGGGRGVGKTAVACALIAALPEFRWAAVKVSSHDYGVSGGIHEETDRNSEKDTGRYLRAGARRAFLASPTLSRSAEELLGDVRARSPDCDGLLVESNRVRAGSLASLGEPTVTLATVAGNEENRKQSLLEHLGRVDAVIVSGGMAAWEFAPPFFNRPVFPGIAGNWAEPGLVRFVRGRLLTV